MGTGLFEEAVQVKSDAREVTKILKKGEEGEEDGHGWEHHRHHPGKSGTSPGRPSRVTRPSIQGTKYGGEPVFEPEEQLGEERGRIISR